MKPPRLVEGQYLILERLGKDEVGAAFLVEDQESGARVVLRSLRPSIVSDPDLSQKLEREVKLAQSLRHAHIRALYEFCWTKDKSEAFIVMEYIQGETLRDYLFKQRGYRCDKAAFYTLANQILSAIDYAHQAGVTHRDLTPDNIMITSEGSIKVSDFGIDATIKEALFKNTRSSIVLSTYYVSPEQVEGHEPVPAMDIHSIGCVFYEMLAGKLPFKERDVIHRRPEEQAKPINGIPISLNNLILQCMNSDQSERPQSVKEIRATFASREISAIQQPEQPTVSGRKFALLSCGLVIILGAFWWYQSSQLSSGVQVETQEESTGKEPKQAESDAEESFLGVAADAPRDLQPAKPGEEAAQRYTIQVGAFGTEEAAQKMLSQLSAKGYSGRIEQPSRGADRYFYVWVGEFTSTEPASRFQTRLKADGFQVYIKRTAGQ